jgi:hypothetical protein
MHVPPELYKSLRGILAICIALAGMFIYLMWRDTRPRDSYEHVTGKLTYLAKTFSDKPYRDFGKYRYVKLDNFNTTFEVYADEQAARMDSLKIGDDVTVWYITYGAIEENPGGMIPKYIYKGQKLYFGNDGDLIVQMGWAVIGILFLTCVLGYRWYKKGKIKW